MTLTELRYVLAAAKVRHFGKAAKLCHVSQPTLSVAINKLEAELGISIFERDRHQVKITEIGKKIIVQMQKVLDEVNHVHYIAETSKSQLAEPLRIGAIYTIGPYLFPCLIPQIRKLAKTMPLLIQEDYTANLRIKLLQGEVDAIFISLPFTEPGILTKALYDEPFVILMPQEHVLSQKSAIRADELSSTEMLLLGEDHCFRNQVIEACPNCYTEENDLQKTMEGSSLETLRHMVASGMGITILPYTATHIQFYKSLLCTKPFAGKIPHRRIALAWRVSFTRPKAIGTLIEAVYASKMTGVTMIDPKQG